MTIRDSAIYHAKQAFNAMHYNGINSPELVRIETESGTRWTYRHKDSGYIVILKTATDYRESCAIDATATKQANKPRPAPEPEPEPCPMGQAMESTLQDFWKDSRPDLESLESCKSETAYFLIRELCHGESYTMADSSWALAYAVINSFNPVLSQEHIGKLCIYQNPDKRSRDIKTATKPARAIRKMFSFLSESELNRIADKWREKFGADQFDFYTGETARDFRHAYDSAIAPMMNPATSCARKSLANSCMQGGCSFAPIHPAETYASGDFAVYWIENKQGEIAARAVAMVARNGVKLDFPKHGPIYGTSESALDCLTDHLQRLGAIPAESWQGARLRRYEYSGGFVAPYLDVAPSEFDDSGDYLIISCDGEYDTSSAHSENFIIESENRYSCDCCNSRLSEDEIYIPDYGHEVFCESCYGERFTYCENCEETVNRDDCETVYIWSRYGRLDSQCWCNSCRASESVETESDETWRESDTMQNRDGETISIQDYEFEYFTCDMSGEICPMSDHAETDSGDCVDVNLLRDDSRYELRGDIWHMIQLEFEFA